MAGHVLVVEDEEEILAFVEFFLGQAGLEVVTATNGALALDRVAERMPDVILLDLRMPVMSGPEFAAELDRRYARRAPIIVITAADNAERRASEIAADGWLAKPFDPRDLLALVERTLAEGR